MKRLKLILEGAGMEAVRTYINSGNIIFKDKRRESTLLKRIEAAIEEEFGLAVPVLLKDAQSVQAIAQAIPAKWVNNSDMRTDVLFLWKNVDTPDVLKSITIKPEIEDVRYTPGAILWRVDRANATRSNLPRLVGTALYKSMTIRNCNTVRKLAAMMQ